MNQQLQYTNVPSYAGHQQLLMSNGYTSAQWSTVQSSMSLPVIHPQNNSAMSPQLSPMRWRSNCCCPNNQNNFSHSGCEVPGSMDQVWHPVHHPPNSSVSMIRADNMTIEQTAVWVQTLGRYNQWEEADEYAKKFADNQIWGWLLQKITRKTLEEDLGIAKFGHRLEIMSAIKCLFPKNAPSKHFAENMQKYIGSPMAESEGETGSLEDTASSMQERSPSVSSSNVCSQCNGDVETIEHISSKKVTPAVHPFCSDRTGKSSSNSIRARPSNPVVFKTLRKAELRSGKVGLAKTLGYLPKGSIVVINQIKGRSGRVVFQDQLGNYKRAGWVTLYTEDNQQVLRKYNPPTSDRGFALSSFADVLVE